MNKRTEQLLTTLKEERHFIESLIKNDTSKIAEYERALQFHRNELTEINDLIRKLDKK